MQPSAPEDFLEPLDREVDPADRQYMKELSQKIIDCGSADAPEVVAIRNAAPTKSLRDLANVARTMWRALRNPVKETKPTES